MIILLIVWGFVFPNGCLSFPNLFVRSLNIIKTYVQAAETQDLFSPLQDRISQCSPECPGTYYIYQDGLQLAEICLPLPPVLALKAYTISSGLRYHILHSEKQNIRVRHTVLLIGVLGQRYLTSVDLTSIFEN